ncbi:type II CRISPR RNA-guided endonuclease Cas9 [Rhodovulum sulfidophilum]|uniref:CRISPR-associated endonuclease Cas9 n=1 Tax=Rhodovulum visakhapatnamense TaxID=364297 RepID=A0ABS1RJ70_9RHOB|nr:type II CRISPR RNA-guided endonuclease Cas9 [Rhodovulum visakhapatnamense]MBL3571594.1 type II CRISPR RNA-guided endonuclease Cas9 [Rhodovulum visakhapatnamense]MBL3579683.1 type II CRISPR RNA-guided endonuclease Cas9 [Rhodovulum visakhapatnamense]OLS45982.1 type II CRISPR RNA-guided endonuclease Cas9 [Rhodovulum sulfidophilum]
MRLGLDIGTNSIGWWLYETDGFGAKARITGVINGGVRVFSDGRDPQSGASLAVDRRTARAMRRRRDRYLRRRATLMRLLANAGLMPADPVEAKALEALDPYALRAAGLDEALPLTHLGRALFHINQRRGFKSNRKTDHGDNESGKIKEATGRLEQEMMAKGARTYGEFLHLRRTRASHPRHVPTVRTRLSVANRDGPNGKEEAGYDFYPDRRHLEEEFHKLWAAQATFHPDLTNNLRDLVFEKIFYQRALKEPEVGLCLFSGYDDIPPDERRLPKAHPLSQRRTLLETVNQLRVTLDGRERRPLTREERDQIIHALDNKKPTKKPPMSATQGPTLTLKYLAEKVLRLPDGQRFTLETGVRDAIACDPVRASLSHPDRFGPRWSTLDPGSQWEVISRIQNDADYAALVEWLASTYALDRDHAEAIANAPLPAGHGRLGLAATTRILEKLEEDVVTFADAVAACGWHHSDQRTGECLDRLPYYGEVLDRHVIPGTYDAKDDDVTRYGRITNPTVHIGLNQLRRLVNLIIEVYGKPDQIVVELARELKQSDQQKREVMKRIRDTTEAAKKRSKKLEELGIEDTGRNRMLLRLWEDLNPEDIMRRFCPYTGRRISAAMIFDGSCDVDHILPYSRTLDDSFANRTLCLREANREKRNQAPWEAWGGTPKWDAIETNMKNLPENKRWRFSPDAMQRFEGEKDFLDRALVDTQYLARISRAYLDTLFTEGGHVWVVPGRLTEMLRRHWGLNSLLSDRDRGAVKVKNRTDHRHHAIDAAVVAATDRSLLNRISRAAGQGEEAGQSAELIARDTPPPWDGFRSDLDAQLRKIIVSHRADHGRIDREGRKHGRGSTSGQLHQETAYSIVDDTHVASRTDLLSVKPAQLLDELGRSGQIRDPQLRKALRVATAEKIGKDYEKALRDFAAKPGPYQGIRRVRIIKPLQEQARIPVPEQRPIKAYQGGSNHCFEIWQLPDGQIQSQVITTYEAHRLECHKRPHPAAKRLLSVHKGDMLALEREGRTVVGYVQQMHVKNGLFIVPHNEANADARNSDKTDPFRWIQIAARPAVDAGIRRIAVDEIGRLRDGGAKRR